MITALPLVLLAMELGFAVLSIVATVKVITKAGYSGWWILASFVPLLNFVMFLVFAFSKWPIERQLEAARRSGRQDFDNSGRYSWAPALGNPALGARDGRSWDYLG